MATPNISMQKAGFTRPNLAAVRRMLVATDGLEKTGKTDFALTAPGPIDVIDLDNGLEGVAEKHMRRGKDIRVKHIRMPAFGVEKHYLNIWKDTIEAYRWALTSDSRTVFIDTGSDLWELMRLAEFGKLAPSADVKRAYNDLNQLYRSFVREAYSTNKNLIITHKLKENWITKKKSDGKEQDMWDGTYRRNGFRETAFLIQANLRHERNDNGDFIMRVVDCRQNMGVAGFEFMNEDITWANLGMAVFEGSTAKDWA